MNLNQEIDMSHPKTEQMKEEARRTGEEAREEIDQAVEATKEKGRQLAGEAKQEASKIAEQQQQNVAHHMESIADALNKTATNLDEDQVWVASGARQTAQALDNMSKSLRENDFNTIVRDIERYTREQPTLVLGGAAIAGFFLSRFLKSSDNRGSADTSQTAPLAGNKNDQAGVQSDVLISTSDISRRP
jgi:hypothetical protein